MKIQELEENFLSTLAGGISRALGGKGSDVQKLAQTKSLRQKLNRESYKDFIQLKRNEGSVGGAWPLGLRVRDPSAEATIAQSAVPFALEYFLGQDSMVKNVVDRQDLYTFITRDLAAPTDMSQLPTFFSQVSSRYNQLIDKAATTIPSDRLQVLTRMKALIDTFTPDEQTKIEQLLKIIATRNQGNT